MENVQIDSDAAVRLPTCLRSPCPHALMVFDVIPKVKRKDLVVDISEAIFRCLFTSSSGLGKMAAHLTKRYFVQSGNKVLLCYVT